MYENQKLTPREFEKQKERIRKIAEGAVKGLEEQGFKVLSYWTNVWKGEIALYDFDPEYGRYVAEMPFYFQDKDTLVFINEFCSIPKQMNVLSSIFKHDYFKGFDLEDVIFYIPTVYVKNERNDKLYFGLGFDEEPDDSLFKPQYDSIEDEDAEQDPDYFDVDSIPLPSPNIKTLPKYSVLNLGFDLYTNPLRELRDAVSDLHGKMIDEGFTRLKVEGRENGAEIFYYRKDTGTGSVRIFKHRSNRTIIDLSSMKSRDLADYFLSTFKLKEKLYTYHGEAEIIWPEGNKVDSMQKYIVRVKKRKIKNKAL